MVDYRKLRPNNITSPEFKHLLLLLYWPVYGLTFWLLERGLSLEYHPVVSPLDAKIPFCEYFVFPYYFWFAFLVGIHLYTLLFDIPAFKKLMYFIMITYTVTTLIYIFYPTMQELRPTEFERDNFCVDIVKALYAFDTNTNVCPSLHVIGSFAVYFTTLYCKPMRKLPYQLLLALITVLISISTIFLKQHSVIDIFAALALCAAAFPFAYVLPDLLEKRRAAAETNLNSGEKDGFCSTEKTGN